MIRLVFSVFLINPPLLSDYVKHQHLKAHLSTASREGIEKIEGGGGLFLSRHELATENWSHFSLALFRKRQNLKHA